MTDYGLISGTRPGPCKGISCRDGQPAVLGEAGGLGGGGGGGGEKGDTWLYI